ncbi:MAG: sugar-transfer associated ATP-grasp domain-containing protein, partial [Candidatus Eisenbacteria bacterium]|nr:sugar-transfer associated ATP-grasp domain-containing protein [Candidatus Eisenbacteria bacterium]
MRRDVAGRAMSFGRTARNVQRLISAELHGRASVPFGKRVWGWRRGFTGESTARYELTPENVNEYVSDTARYIRTPRINGPFASALLNKLAFSDLVARHGGPTPEYYCIASDRGLLPIGDRYDMSDADGVVAACMTGERFVVKPVGGGGGAGVRVISSTDGRLTVNGKPVDESEFRAFVARLSGSLICEFIVQHEYATTIFPHSTNSIRVLSMWDYENDTPFLPFAGQRFGRTSSIPTDNVTQGGIPVQVDVASGKLRRGVLTRPKSATEWLEQHPDTGAQITDVVVPNWDIVTTGLVELARRMPYIPYVGWD